MHAILEAAFPSRIKAVRALLGPAGPDAAAELEVAYDAIRETLGHIHDDGGQADWQSLAESVAVAAKLRSWHQAVRTGEADADRFLRAARLQLAEWQVADTGYGQKLKAVLAVIEGEFAASQVGNLLASIGRVPFPVSIYTSDPPRGRPDWALAGAGTRRAGTAKPELAVAFLEFRINGQEAAVVHRLSADQLHDLELKVRVSRWPDGAERLVLKPVTVEPNDIWSLPEFEFTRPAGYAPFLLEALGRLSIRARLALGARPLEFLYSAEFHPVSAEQPVAVAGQRSLRLDSSENLHHLETGYPSLDVKLVELRDRLRDEPRIPESEVGTALHLLKPLFNIVGQAVQDNRFPEPVDEATFEQAVMQHLRRHPEVGVELEVQAQSTGGRTDLSFRQMRIELKVKNGAQVSDADLRKFAMQTAAYAVGSDKTIGILCILDGSEKKGPPVPMAEAISIIPVQPGDRPVYVITLVLQGNLARPSHLSR